MTAPVVAQAVTAHGRYEQLSVQRNAALQRAREASALTIPSLIPPEGVSDATKLPQPFQSVGTRGVNNLAAKLLLALFPPGTSFFRLQISEFLMDKIKEKAGLAGETDPQAEIDASLSKVERAILTKFEEKAHRPQLSECLKHLIVGGNGLLQILADGSEKFHPLANYVVKRDTEGTPVEIITREGLSRRTLPPEVEAIVSATEQTNPEKATDDNIWVYTWVQRGDKSWAVHQEVVGVPIPETNATYPLDTPAWLPLRWTAVAGSDYGRGHCEEYLGDLHSYESLSQSLVEFSANASKVLWLVDEGGTTQKKTLAEAPNGAIRDGNAKDVTLLMMEKFADFQVTKSQADTIEKRLEQAFLLNSSVQRNAERVTAEEIRLMAADLEQALGGTYSLLSGELQFPLVVRLMATMTRAKELPALPKGAVVPTIITGLDGLGRSSDLMKLDLLLQGAGEIFGPQGVTEYTNIGSYLKRRAAALGIDIGGIVRTEQEVQATRQAAQQQAMLQKTAPAGIKAMSDNAVAAQKSPSGGTGTNAPS
jgi:hypothetical protein